MSSPHATPLSRLAAGTILVSTLLFGACSSDGTTVSGSTTTAPEQRISTDAEVAAGLAKMQASVAKIVAAGPDTAKAAAADDELEPVWKTIEGTVKKNEPDIYVNIEDSMSLLSSGVEGDQEKGTVGATDMNTAIADYLAKHPG